MTNWEKYKDMLTMNSIAGYSFGVNKNNIPKVCCTLTVDDLEALKCEDCKFFSKKWSCRKNRLKWLDQEYQEPKEPDVDWSKVAIDTPILVRDSHHEDWRKRHFAKYADGNIFAYDLGKTSFTSNGYLGTWQYAKLAESEIDNDASN